MTYHPVFVPQQPTPQISEPSLSIAPLTAKLNKWKIELDNDIDREFLIDGIQYGFKIASPPENIKCVHRNNYNSATKENRDLVEKQIIHEIQLGRYQICDYPPAIVSSIGAIPKKSGGCRLIHDCSKPVGCSVNSYTTRHHFKYQTVDNAVELLPQSGWMAKIDLSSAYRSVGIHPSCYKLMGLHWIFSGDSNPTYFYDTRFCFGGSECPEKFQRLSNAVTRMMQRRGYTVCAYLDDYLVIAPTQMECDIAYKELVMLL